jgi:hypothetical protein
MLFPDRFRVLRYVFVGKTWERAFSPVAVMPLAEKSTVSKVCLTKGKLRNHLTR